MTHPLNPPKPADFNRAVEILTSPAAFSFLDKIKLGLEEDTHYLLTHERSVAFELDRMLFGSGIRWTFEQLQEYRFKVLKIALEKTKGSS